MRGGLVACFGANGANSTRLEHAVTRLRWHRGRAEEHHSGRLHLACLVDDRDGPVIDVGAERVLVAHGAPAARLPTLQSGRSRFAALEWDGRSLRASRDPMGEVPLFYRLAHGALWFSTEIHPLVALGGTSPDLHALAAFAATVEYPERTGWEGIYRVLPGETVEVDPERHVSASRYWIPEVDCDRGSPTYGAVVKRFRELLDVALERRISGNVGILLSGGLDSSAVAVAAARLASPALLTVSYPTLPEMDETRYAEAVAAAAGLPLKTVEGRLDPWDPGDDLSTFGVPPVKLPTGAFDTALHHIGALGCDVAFDGQDGDGVLGIYHAEFGNVVLDGRPWRLAGVAQRHGWPWTLRKTAEDFASPSIRSTLRRGKEGTIGDRFLPYFRGPIHSRLVDHYGWRSPRSGWRQAQLRPLLPPATQIFEENETQGARFGVDVRHPFADRDLIELLIGLPHAIKASPTRNKPILRDALTDLLPNVVTDRLDKADFSAAMDRRVDYEACYKWIRDSGVRLAEIDYGRLFRDAVKPDNDRVLWSRLASVHLFAAGAAR